MAFARSGDPNHPGMPKWEPYDAKRRAVLALLGAMGKDLSWLHRQGVLTIALDDRREWFRYHGLLVELLRTMLEREQPELVPALHVRAARWLAA